MHEYNTYASYYTSTFLNFIIVSFDPFITTTTQNGSDALGTCPTQAGDASHHLPNIITIIIMFCGLVAMITCL